MCRLLLQSTLINGKNVHVLLENIPAYLQKAKVNHTVDPTIVSKKHEGSTEAPAEGVPYITVDKEYYTFVPIDDDGQAIVKTFSGTKTDKKIAISVIKSAYSEKVRESLEKVEFACELVNLLVRIYGKATETEVTKEMDLFDRFTLIPGEDVDALIDRFQVITTKLDFMFEYTKSPSLKSL
ncbi:hypothetical protein HDV05_003503, partial [Chytridiales sp. JEL 0842]